MSDDRNSLPGAYLVTMPRTNGETGGYYRSPLEPRLRNILKRYNHYLEMNPDPDWFFARSEVYLRLGELEKALAASTT